MLMETWIAVHMRAVIDHDAARLAAFIEVLSLLGGVMTEYRIKGGHTITDEDFERMSEEAERREYPGAPGEWIVRPQGRPAPTDQELETDAPTTALVV